MKSLPLVRNVGIFDCGELLENVINVVDESTVNILIDNFTRMKSKLQVVVSILETGVAIPTYIPNTFEKNYEKLNSDQRA